MTKNLRKRILIGYAIVVPTCFLALLLSTLMKAGGIVEAYQLVMTDTAYRAYLVNFVPGAFGIPTLICLFQYYLAEPDEEVAE
ncbi:hypothetical protein [Neptuniibacter sp. QD37_11]|uniref:hypothetical protein n=1 Tax=Neptuniibacter sp. QD37_11 TaxID=3398209 RepID=UPI0039F5EE57